MTNAAAIGYAILAAKALGMSNEELRRLEYVMYRLMDEVTEETAEDEYRNN
jgi:hypothetical protein